MRSDVVANVEEEVEVVVEVTGGLTKEDEDKFNEEERFNEEEERFNASEEDVVLVRRGDNTLDVDAGSAKSAWRRRARVAMRLRTLSCNAAHFMRGGSLCSV
jgi:hypothetical protein